MANGELKVWDLPVRLFHWALVLLVGFSWWSGEVGGLTLQYHMWSGYAILTLLLFRLAWGVTGSESARFAHFLHGPRRVLLAVRELLSREPMPYAGHNPLGGWMVMAMLLALLVQVGSGLFANDDLLNEGPLYRYVGKDFSDSLTAVHHRAFLVVLALVAVHVAAIAYHRVRKGERLVTAMFTGRKRLVTAAFPLHMTGSGRALFLLIASAVIVAVLVFPR